MQQLSLEITKIISGGMTPDTDDYDGDDSSSGDKQPKSGSSGSPFIPPGFIPPGFTPPSEAPDPLDDDEHETM